MAKHTRQNPIGTLPIDPETCVTLRDRQGAVICEAYVYRVGFFRFNWHPSLEILFVLEGRVSVFTERGKFEVGPDGFLVIQPNEGHASMLEEPGTVAAVMHISQRYLERICAKLPVIHCFYEAMAEQDETYQVIRRGYGGFFTAASEGEQLGNRLLAEAELLRVTGTLVKNCASKVKGNESIASTQQQSKKLMEIQQQIEDHYLEEITLESLAASVSMNPSYLSSFFKKHMQMGFHEYVTRKRLTRAVWSLNNSERTVMETALDAGFPDAKALYAAFRKYFGMTPNSYREKMQEQFDATAMNYIPTRLSVHDAYVQERIQRFITCGS